MKKFTDVEYIKVWRTEHTKGEKPAFLAAGDEIEGFTITDLAQYIAKRLGQEGVVSYSYKLRSKDRWDVSKINAFYEPKKKDEQEPDSVNIDEIKRHLEEVFKMKEDIYKLQIEKLKLEITALETKLQQTEAELEASSSDEPDELINTISGLFNKAMDKHTPARLSDYAGPDISGIPAVLVDVLNEIDYARMDPQRVEDLAGKLRGSFTIFSIPIKRKA